jgi:hypothetical protein
MPCNGPNPPGHAQRLARIDKGNVHVFGRASIGGSLAETSAGVGFDGKSPFLQPPTVVFGPPVIDFFYEGLPGCCRVCADLNLVFQDKTRVNDSLNFSFWKLLGLR